MKIDLYNPCEGEDNKYIYNSAVSQITITRDNNRGIMKMVFTRLDVPPQMRPIVSPVDFTNHNLLCMAWGYFGQGTGEYGGPGRKNIMWFPVKRRHNWSVT